jgi:hypothetical protein
MTQNNLNFKSVASSNDDVYPNGVHYSIEGFEREVGESFAKKNPSGFVDNESGSGPRTLPFFEGVDGLLKVATVDGVDVRGKTRVSIYEVYDVHGHKCLCIDDGTKIGDEDGVAPEWMEILSVNHAGRKK